MNFHVKLKYDANLKPLDMAKKVINATKENYLVHITDVPLTGDSLHYYYENLTNHIGDCLDIGETPGSIATGEKWTYVCYDPTIPDAYRSSLNAQPLHTDGSYQIESPDATCMYCISTAPKGGETIFICGERIIQCLQSDRPALYNKLITIPVCFSRKFINGENKKTRRIIERDDQGNVTLTWNYYRVDPDSSEEVKQMCSDFHNYLQDNIMNSDKILAIQLQPGEAALWLDEKLLHGRNSFTAQNYGDRNLAKVCLNIGQI